MRKENGTCQVTDSYGLPLTTYNALDLETWLQQWRLVQLNEQALQALNSSPCGHYALMFLKERVQGRTMTDFGKGFSPVDFVGNDGNEYPNQCWITV